MSASVVKYWAYLSGILIPVHFVQRSNAQGDMAMGFVQTPFSPFLIHLPRATKITLFEFDSAIDDEPILAFDGTVTQVVESIGNGSTALNLVLSSDGWIWKVRNRTSVRVETMFSQSMAISAAVAADGSQNVNVGISSNISDFMTNVLQAAKDDAAKASMAFLTGLFRPPAFKDDPNSGYYYIDGNTREAKRRRPKSAEESLGEKTLIEAMENGDQWTPFLRRYYDQYQLSEKVAYISQQNSDVVLADYVKRLVAQRLDSERFGSESYWDLSKTCSNFLDAEVICVPDASFSEGAIVEFIAKPISPLGALPLCNIVFPNQIQQYTKTRNYFGEPTRMLVTGQSNPMIPDDNLAVFQATYSGPTLSSGSLKSFCVPVPQGKDYLAHSEYEAEYGIRPVALGGHHVDVMLSALSNKEAIDKVVNFEFVKHYFGSQTLAVEVDPNQRYVIGMTMAILRHDGNHTLAYLYGTTHTWDALSGTSSLHLQLAYPRDYRFQAPNEIEELTDGFKDEANRKMYARHIGLNSDSVKEAGDETIAAVEEAFSDWAASKMDSNSLKLKNLGKYRRRHCTYPQYCEFMGGEVLESDYFDRMTLSMPVAMPEECIQAFDTTDSGAKLSTALYSYYDVSTKKTVEAKATRPSYSELGTPGKIVPSTYVSGIVNCHLRYLAEGAHAIQT